MADSQVYDPTHDQPLAVGDRVRIVKAHRTGSELFSWERRLAGRYGRITGIFQRSAPAQDAYLSIAVALDPLTPRQRTEHSADLKLLCAYDMRCVDLIERIAAT